MLMPKPVFKLLLLFVIYFLVIFSSSSQITISEFMAINASGLQDDDNEYSDWIEIENNSGNTINLKGYYLSDNQENLTKWKFPDKLIENGAYLIVFASEKNRTSADKPLHTNFKLSGSGEYLALINPDGKTVISAYSPQFPAQKENVSYGMFNGIATYFEKPSPGSKNTQISKVQPPIFSKPGGYYKEKILLTLSTNDAGVDIYYTTDGTIPTRTSAKIYKEPLIIQNTTPLSAVSLKSDNTKSELISHTYFFVDSILKQNNSPIGYPKEWGIYEAIPGRSIADYEMDPEIVNSALYKAQLEPAFLDIPSISIVTNPDYLFSHSTDNETGGIYIYTCPSGKGIGAGWERPASIEYFDPKNKSRFQINCALQIHGGASRVPEKTPKHSFRIEFKTKYGPSKLEYPLFEQKTAVSQFNSLVLRANFGYTWLHWSPTERKNPKYVQDSWAKDTQLEMGYPSAHSKFVHLFLNGLYWGMYNLSERVDESFMASYLKGKTADFDIIKDYTEAAAGDLNIWNAMMTMANQGLSDNAAYQKIQGNNPDGKRNMLLEPYIDVQNLADYMLLNFYGGNNDWDHHNWIAARNRINPEKGFKFFSWDAEHLFTSSTIDVTKENNANCPSRLFTKLKDNSDFRILVADRAKKWFFADGVLSPQKVAARYELRTKEIEKAIIAESARWGDYRRDVHPRDTDNDLYTPEKYWVKTLNWLNNTYFPNRTELVINQLRISGLYPYVDAPVFSNQGGYINSAIQLEMKSNSGIIYYTLNNTDPRNSGGQISTNAVSTYNSPIKIYGNGTVKARVKDGNQWSALTEATFSITNPTLIIQQESNAREEHGAFPNPFSNSTKIYFSIENDSEADVSIFTANGKLIERIYSGNLQSGSHAKSWNPKGIQRGIYIYKITTNDGVLSGKIVHL